MQISRSSAATRWWRRHAAPAMGKKKAEEMAKHRETIAEGPKQKGYDPALAEQLFDLMTKFAEYGFNKSHTAAYAVVTYHTAWLKAYHCAAFMAATMSSDMDNTDTVKIFYEDTAGQRHVTVLPPDVNASHYRFVPTDRKTVRYGLGAVKGCGEPAVLAIIAAREKDGPFKDLFDFANRVDRRSVNRRVFEALIRAGAFDSLDKDRAKLMAVGVAMEAAEQKAANAMQGGLFDMLPDAGGPMAEYAKVRRGPNASCSRKRRSRSASFSGHPSTASARRCAASSRRTLAKLEPSRNLPAGRRGDGGAGQDDRPRQDRLRHHRRWLPAARADGYLGALRQGARQDRGRRSAGGGSQGQ